MEFTTLLNFRDLGGKTGAGGATVRSGLLFRSEGLFRLTPQEQLALRDEYGIRTVVDFRSQEERALQPDLLPDGIRYLALTPIANLAAIASQTAEDGSRMGVMAMLKAGMGERFLGMEDKMIQMMQDFVLLPHNRRIFGELLKLLLDKENCGILQHCKGGKDRTGFGSAMILAALGVQKQDIMADYLLSNQQKKHEIDALMQQVREIEPNPAIASSLHALFSVQAHYLEAAFAAMDEQFGGLDGFLQQGLGLTPQNQQLLQQMYLQ